MEGEEGNLILSIVMITVPERRKEFLKLFTKVNSQIEKCLETHPTLGMVKVVKVNSKKFVQGGPSIGNKRQQGLIRSAGKYVCWLYIFFLEFKYCDYL